MLNVKCLVPKPNNFVATSEDAIILIEEDQR
jgi:hypothetical protein